jgi:Metallo-peptidase family M12B Reprolysin-like/Secretion system C-terminal sorting domain
MKPTLASVLKTFFTVFLVYSLSVPVVFAQNSWDDDRDVTFDLPTLVNTLAKAPMENTPAAANTPLYFDLPMPSGGERRFSVVESPIMSADFAALYPTFKTYAVVATDNPRVTGRLTLTPYGFHAYIHLETGKMGIRPRDLLNPKIHQVYSGEGESIENASRCAPHEAEMPPLRAAAASAVAVTNAFSNGATRRNYRFAIVTTGEFTASNGGTVGAATSVVTASVNAIQSIYDRELSVRFTLLIPFIYTDASTDPFTRDAGGGGAGDSRPNQAAEAVQMNFAVGNYDIGHVLHNSTTGNFSGGGVAALGAVCSNGTFFATATGSSNPNEPDGLTGYDKAAGWSGSFENTSNGWYSLFAHEIGHMFSMNHTFNGSGSSCTAGNISSTTAYEIASGSGIMSYKGICSAAQNIPSNGAADNYFHTNSLESAVSFMGTINCQTSTATGNTPPVVNANPCGGNYTIPVGTPFTLTGSGSDANGDVVYYAWEQYDEDGAGSPTQGFIGATAAASAIAPLFRNYPPSTTPSRTFPALSAIVSNGYATDFEPLPTVARTLNFRLTGRDFNANGGGIHCSAIAVTVSAAGGAFSVNAPNGGEIIAAGGNTTVTWTTNTTAFSTNVNIKMSTDGGFTYPYILASNVSNATGSQSVTLPAGVTATTTARIMVESADNTCVRFFDISNANFTVTSSCLAAGNTICDAAIASFTLGNAALNLDLSKVFTTTTTTSQIVTVNGTDPINNRAMKDAINGTTCTVVGTRAYKFFDFIVSASGTYSISISNSSGFIASSIFTAAGFNANSPCSSTFLGSNAYSTGGGSTSSSSPFSVTLTACTLYRMMVYTSTAAYDVNTTISFSGSGSVLVSGTDPGGSYGYTYLAVNTSSNQIALVNAASNFTTLSTGTYDIYGASFNNSVSTASWTGQTLSQILSAGSCTQFSANAKRVIVTAALPIELLHFRAAAFGKMVKLTWQTASEINNKGFQVERQNPNGKDWDILGYVSTKGNGANYTFEDNAPLRTSYYRLRQIDNDGKETFSNIVNIVMEGKTGLSIYPNPTKNDLTVQYNGDATDFDIFNILGQSVLQGKINQNVDVSRLAVGTYIVKVGSEQVKFVKQ